MSAQQVTVWMIRCDGLQCVQWERGSHLELLVDWITKHGWTVVGDHHYCPAHEPDNR